MKLYIKSLLILFALLSADNLYARLQGQARLDSLEKELNLDKYRNREDTNTVNLLESLSYNYYSINPDKGIKYGMQQLELAKKIKWEKGKAMAYQSIATNILYKSDYAKTFEYYDSALKIFEQQDDKNQLAGCLSSIGYAYTLSGDFEKALAYDLKALEIFEGTRNKNGAANTLGNIGSLYMNKGDYAKALDYSFRALKMNEESGNKSSIAANLGSIGSIYILQKDNPKALDYYFKALAINTELGKKSSTAGNYANIGCVYQNQNDDAKALEYNFKALAIYEEMGTKTGMALVLGNIGDIYSAEHNYTQSVAFLFKALKIAREAGDKNAEAALLGAISESYRHMATETIKNNDIVVAPELYQKPYIPDSLIPGSRKAALHKALEYVTMAVNLENHVGNLNYQQQFYQDLAGIDSLLGDYKSALYAYEQYKNLQDSAFNGENNIKITNLETKREIDLKDKQIEINKLAVEKKQNERIFFIAGIVLLLMVIMFILRNYYGQKKSNMLLSKEKKRSEDLLLNILPAEVAEELKEKGTADAKQFDEVTVIFTDFVNFTRAGEKMSPQQLVNELHTCFIAFDGIITRNKVEKIKTVGDAYLAVSGLPVADTQHAEQMVNAALEIKQFMRERKNQVGEATFDIRIGIHSGSVVAGIVGLKKFAYDIWGDTVNTASRMEQNCEPGKINISQITYELVKEKFTCEYRGEIEAKNKGMLKMYYIGSNE